MDTDDQFDSIENSSACARSGQNDNKVTSEMESMDDKRWDGAMDELYRSYYDVVMGRWTIDDECRRLRLQKPKVGKRTIK